MKKSHMVLITLILTCLICGQDIEGTVSKGMYTLRRAKTPTYLVTGISLDVLSKVHFANMRKVTDDLPGQWGGGRTLFDTRSKKEIKIGAGVYYTVAEAEDAALELLNSVSITLKSGSRSGREIGTHSWYNASRSGSGIVVFNYYNALFQVFSSDYAFAENCARAILEGFKKGTNGISLGLKVDVPKIQEIIIPAELRQGKEATVQVKATDPNQQKLSFFVTASNVVVKGTADYTTRLIIPQHEGSDEIRVYAVNKLNVISEVYTKSIKIGK